MKRFKSQKVGVGPGEKTIEIQYISLVVVFERRVCYDKTSLTFIRKAIFKILCNIP